MFRRLSATLIALPLMLAFAQPALAWEKTDGVCAYWSAPLPPYVVAPGSTFPVQFWVLNTGKTNFKKSYSLISQTPVMNMAWGANEVPLGKPLQSGKSMVVDFRATAPLIPGFYSFNWRLSSDGTTFFGIPCEMGFTVSN